MRRRPLSTPSPRQIKQLRRGPAINVRRPLTRLQYDRGTRVADVRVPRRSARRSRPRGARRYAMARSASPLMTSSVVSRRRRTCRERGTSAAMGRLVMFLTVLNLTACAKKESGSSASSGSATGSPVEQASSSGSAAAAAGSAAAGSAPTGSASATGSPATGDGADEVARLVVHDVGSNALGNQKIEASCVSVSVMPAGDWTVAAARLKDCGDKTARSILWVYKRQRNGKWSEDYLGQPPRCWKGVPADIAEAVSKATKIPSC